MRGFLSEYLKGKKTISIEGFELQKMLTQCLDKGITLRNVKTKSEIEIEFQISKSDYKIFKDFAKNKYKIFEIRDSGFPFLLNKLWGRKSFIAGIFIFIFLMYYQSLFISEIEIIGCDKVKESVLREKLEEAGFYEGSRKIKDIDSVKSHIYSSIDDIGWIGINYEGNLAKVEIAERDIQPEIVNINTPCDIRAAKSGYIYKIIAKYGVPLVREGDFVKQGDVLISGMLAKQHENDPQNKSDEIKYVHALGEVYAKIIYRFVFYEEKNEINKIETGKNIVGLDFKIGDFRFNTGKFLLDYDYCVSDCRKIIGIVKPIPIKISLINYKEVEIKRVKRSNESVKADIQKLIRENIRKNVAKNAQIINKDLKFMEGENIIKVTVILEAIESIGQENKITPLN